MSSPPGSGDASNGTPEVQKYRPRACQSCARSKMRCVWPSEPGASPCQRCAKIKAPCTLPELNPRRRRGPSTRVGQLEEKIDGIMSLLNASQQISQSSQTPPGSERGNGIQSLLNPLVEPVRAESEPQILPRILPPPSLTTDTTSTPRFQNTPPTEYIDIIPGFRMTLDEADRALNLYRSVYYPSFPFVPIPAMMTAYELYVQKPFLFRTIIQIAAPQPASIQRDVKRWFREYIAEHVVVKQQKSIELLQAIILYLAWGDAHYYLESRVTSLLQLALGIVIDLGLMRHPQDFASGPHPLVQDAKLAMKYTASYKQDHSLDDMRAMLGCFYESSVISTLFRRVYGLPYTPYVGKCLEVLQHAKEYVSDNFLVALVRMQRLVLRIHDISPIPHLDISVPSPFYGSMYMTIAAIRKELDAIVEGQPPEVECNVLLWTQYYCSLSRLYEPAIFMRSSLKSDDPTATSFRTDALWNCLQAAKDFFKAYAAIPTDNLGSVPFGPTVGLSFMIVTASRLLLLDDSDWDVGLARRSFDFALVCEHIADRYDEAENISQTLGRRRRILEDKSILAMYRDKLRWLRHWYLSKMPDLLRTTDGASSKDAAASSMASAGGGQAMELDQQASLLQPGELDEGFWQALMDFSGHLEWAD